jgi:hypothetical protein
LLRRVTFDLTGLPPAPEEIYTFVADPSPDAFARAVDRLLASPAYGERWGRHWLDVARYADTKGYAFEEERRFPYAYTYRDYVIRAFNEDLPYDRFVLEQLAADQLPLGEDKRPLAAMGFLTLGRRFLNKAPDIIDDRIDVVTRGLLGLTVGCARCHDHRYDPIPTADYYSFYGVFANSEEPPEWPLIAPADATPAAKAFETERQARRQEVDQFLQSQRAELAAGVRARAADLLLASRNAERRPGEEPLKPLLPGELPPRVVNRWRTYLNSTRSAHHPVLAPWHAFAALSQGDFPARAPDLARQVAANIDRDKPVNPLVARAFADRPPGSLRDVAIRYGVLFERAELLWRDALKLARDRQAPEPTVLPDAAWEAVRQVVYAVDPYPDLPPAEVERQLDPPSRERLKRLRKKADQWEAAASGAPPRAMVLRDRSPLVPTFVSVRGNPDRPGPKVPRQFLHLLAGDGRKPFTHGSGRLELAQAIASRQNPLTARVLVNRVWQHLFGEGLVRTPSDFGSRGEPPTHPELLDYLASEFVESGWSIKRLHRLILLSRTYQQASDPDPRALELDPENRLLWRMSPKRLEFEALRDAQLAVAGGLDRSVGGPAVELTKAPFPTRRSVYGFIDRQNLPGVYRAFDFASPDTTCPQRHQTVVPQQALYLMNSPFVREQAQRLVARPELAGDQPMEQRITRLYRLLYGREADPEEVEMGLRFLNQAGGENSPRPVPWVEYAQVLLLANEFAYVN